MKDILLGSAATVKNLETLRDSEPPVVVFQQLASKLVEMLSNVRVIKEVAADLVSSYETQIETAAYRKVESLQRLKNQLSIDLCGFPIFRPEWDDIFNQALDELDDITVLIRAKRNVMTRAQGFICKIKDSLLPSASLNEDETSDVIITFKSMITSLYGRLMSRNFVRGLAIEVIEDRLPTSFEQAQKLYESILDNIKWLANELDLYPSTTVEKLAFDILKRQVPKFNIGFSPNQLTASTLSEELPSKPKNDKPNSPFANKTSLEAHFRSQHIAGVPDGLTEVVLPVAAAYSSEYALLTHQLGIVPERGVILFGPPGTGKTMIAQAIASYFGCPDVRIRITSGSNLLDKWVGSTEASIRDLFNPARKERDHLHVIIIDEIDAILSARQHANNSWEKTQVTQFLTELDGIRSPRNIFVIGITNFVENLDSAATRPGRLGNLIEVSLPNLQQRAQIFQLHLSFIAQCRLDATYDSLAQELSLLTEGFSGADIRATIQRTANLVFMETIRAGHFTQDAVTTECGRPITSKDFIPVIELIFKQKKERHCL